MVVLLKRTSRRQNQSDRNIYLLLRSDGMGKSLFPKQGAAIAQFFPNILFEAAGDNL